MVVFLSDSAGNSPETVGNVGSTPAGAGPCLLLVHGCAAEAAEIERRAARHSRSPSTAGRPMGDSPWEIPINGLSSALLHPHGETFDVSMGLGGLFQAPTKIAAEPKKEFGDLVRRRRRERGLPVAPASKALPILPAQRNESASHTVSSKPNL